MHQLQFSSISINLREEYYENHVEQYSINISKFLFQRKVAIGNGKKPYIMTILGSRFLQKNSSDYSDAYYTFERKKNLYGYCLWNSNQNLHVLLLKIKLERMGGLSR